uniref:Uncharacterized protein n=1 Tax=Anguilla anguilla TaxID=7936 RepID=A0A0E9W694_ANGAN
MVMQCHNFSNDICFHFNCVKCIYK